MNNNNLKEELSILERNNNKSTVSFCMSQDAWPWRKTTTKGTIFKAPEQAIF